MGSHSWYICSCPYLWSIVDLYDGSLAYESRTLKSGHFEDQNTPAKNRFNPLSWRLPAGKYTHSHRCLYENNPTSNPCTLHRDTIRLGRWAVLTDIIFIAETWEVEAPPGFGSVGGVDASGETCEIQTRYKLGPYQLWTWWKTFQDLTHRRLEDTPDPSPTVRKGLFCFVGVWGRLGYAGKIIEQSVTNPRHWICMVRLPVCLHFCDFFWW